MMNFYVFKQSDCADPTMPNAFVSTICSQLWIDSPETSSTRVSFEQTHRFPFGEWRPRQAKSINSHEYQIQIISPESPSSAVSQTNSRLILSEK